MNFCKRAKYELARGPKLLWEIPSELSAIVFSRRRNLLGIDVLVFDGGTDTEAIFSKVGDALETLAEVDALRFARVKRGLSRILVTDAAGSAYLPLSNSCLLDKQNVVKRDSVRVALTIVHESTHALLLARAITPAGFSHVRVERCCVKQQLDFLKLLKAAGYKGTDAWATYLHESFAQPWWTEEAVFQRQQAMLRRQAAPRWMMSLSKLLFSPKNDSGSSKPRS